MKQICRDIKQICVVTATRAEYGLLRPVMKRLSESNKLDMKIVATGMHLAADFGMTINEIISDGYNVDRRINILISGDNPVCLSKTMGLAIISFAEYFEESRPDAILVLGDRYETLAVCSAAMVAQIPIFHMHGGELTEGLIDDAIRHSITKMSYLHFTSTEEYRKRVIQLGESPERVFNVGATGMENALCTDLLSKSELEASIGLALGEKYAVGTFHPVTLEKMSAEIQIKELLTVIEKDDERFYLFTKSNSDTYGGIINTKLKEYEGKHSNLKLVDSLGMRRYLSAIKYADFVIGNSSSGLVEAPIFCTPTINIGDRQKSRVKVDSVVDCEPNVKSIEDAIKKVSTLEFIEKINNMKNPYGDGKTSKKIVDIIEKKLCEETIDIKKKFYDIKIGEV